jgi:hypothetical protein
VQQDSKNDMHVDGVSNCDMLYVFISINDETRALDDCLYINSTSVVVITRKLYQPLRIATCKLMLSLCRSSASKSSHSSTRSSNDIVVVSIVLACLSEPHDVAFSMTQYTSLRTSASVSGAVASATNCGIASVITPRNAGNIKYATTQYMMKRM